MFNEQTSAGMEIKRVDDQGNLICKDCSCEECNHNEFNNPYANSGEAQDIPSLPSVVLYRSREGIQRWLTRDDVARLLAQTEGKEVNEEFMKTHEKEIEEYFKRQPEGKEVTNVFQILEKGDSVNHQTVVEVFDDHIDLDYFGKKSSVYHEQEIFSILIHEEIEQWKEEIRELGSENLFGGVDLGGDFLIDENMTALYRAMELLCMNIDMERCDGLYLSSNDNLTQRLGGMMSASLKKPILDALNTDKGVICFSADYSNHDLPESGLGIEYKVSLTNKKDKPVDEGDRVVIC